MTEPNDIFEQMKQDLPVQENPGYLQYWEVRAENSPEDARIARIVTGLTHVAIRGEEGVAEYTDRDPSLQARYWYRSLSPTNPMAGVEPDLITAVNLMYGKETRNETESDNLQLDTCYALSELARITDNPKTAMQALRLGVEQLQLIRQRPEHETKDAKYRLQAAILEGDLMQDAIRLRHSGSLAPSEMKGDVFRVFEKDFVAQELRSIAEFGNLVRGGITEQNFGILFEWYFILARRAKAWAAEEIDTTAVRGATSRENAEWTGEDEPNPYRTSGNHDVVITNLKKNGEQEVSRLQLKAVKGDRKYHPRIKVIDFQEALDTRFHSIDSATNHLVRNLVKIRQEYRGEA